MNNPEFLPIIIRDANETDLEAINRIYNFYVANSTATFDTDLLPLEERRRWFSQHGERYPVVVADAGSRVIGWCSLSRYHARPAYQWTAEDSVYIEDGWRGRGVGKLLLGAIIERAQRLGYHRVLARIGDSDNTASRALHQSLGFHLVGIEQEVGYKFGRWLDVVVMQWAALPTQRDA